MKAAVLYGKQDVRLEERPVPRPAGGEVLVKVASALTCGTDLKVFRNGSHARMIKPPALFGHEFAGVIEAVGSAVTGWRPGQRVVAANSAPCRSCFFCRNGELNLCRDLLFVNGAYAEYLLLPARIVQENLLEIPPALSFQAAALTEPLACVVRGIEKANPARGETAVVLGTGPVGLLFIQLLAAAGVEVIVVGKGERRLEAARSAAAGTVLNLAEIADPPARIREKTPEGLGADLVVEAVGRPEAWSQAISLARPGGRVLLFGGCPAGAEVPLDTGRMHYEELTLLSAFHHTPELVRRSLGLLAAGSVRSDLLITQEARLADLPAILRRMLTDQDVVKVAIQP